MSLNVDYWLYRDVKCIITHGSNMLLCCYEIVLFSTYIKKPFGNLAEQVEKRQASYYSFKSVWKL